MPKDSITEIFTKNLPSVPLSSAEAFAQGMEAYHSVYKAHQDSDMNYTSKPEYGTSWNDLVMINPDKDTWVHSPQFRKIIGLAISKLFRTEITMLSPPCTVDAVYSMVFLDAHSNGWVVSVMQSETDLEQFRVCARLPRPNLKTATICKMLTESELSGLSKLPEPIILLVQDTSEWYSQ